MILSLNPVSGISGDMLLGALLDLGAPMEAVRTAIDATGITGWDLRTRSVEREGVRALHAVVEVDEIVPARRAADLLAMAGRATPAPVAAMATSAITSLASVESRIHGVPVADVHLHELGGVDTIVDTVGVAAALNALAISQVWSGPLGMGTGQTSAAHGVLPVPAPATLHLLTGAQVIGIDSRLETVTPTGAALLDAMGTRFGPAPLMTIQNVGYGAGTRETPGRPNVLTAVLGSPVGGSGHVEAMTMLETTVDDVTGEVLGALIPELLTAGAADAWLVPAIGKKNRPAQLVSALCEPHAADAVENHLLRSTGTLGVRRTTVLRRSVPREWTTVELAGFTVRVKIGPHTAKPEHDDLAAIADATGVPVRILADQARALIDDLWAEN